MSVNLPSAFEFISQAVHLAEAGTFSSGCPLDLAFESQYILVVSRQNIDDILFLH